MTEFTDGTAKEKTLSLVEMEKQIEALPTSENVESMITSAIQNLVNSGNVALASNGKVEIIMHHTGLSETIWNDYNIVAPKSGWYSIYVSGTQSNNPSSYIRLTDYANEARANGNAKREFSAGPIWAKAGTTIYYGVTGASEVSLRVS